MKKIAVVGSINIDYFVESDVLPKFGETITGKNFFMSFGGKGANQAVAASRLGGEVALFGSIGDDEQKDILLNHFKKENVDTQYLQVKKNLPTGSAFIQLFNSENRIIYIPGANQVTNIDYGKQILSHLLNYDVILFQLEIPIEILEYLLPILYEHKKMIIVDPAPAQVLSQELVNCITYLTPNEHEYAIVLQQDGPMNEVLSLYPNKLIITCGEKGSYYHDGKKIVGVESIKINAVDATGAGDTFAGALTVALSEGMPLDKCIEFGTVAAGLSVTKKGAQSGMPYRNEVVQFSKEG